MAKETVIRWYPEQVPDRAGLSFIQSALGSNRRMRHARLEVHVPDEIDPPGTIAIVNQNPARMIDPGAVADLIRACLD